MATLTNFSEYYKRISNSELLHILENPNEYQPLAIETAKQEFTNRQLSYVEIQEAKEPLIAKQLEKEKQKQTIKVIENKVKNSGHTLIDTLNPIQTGIPNTEKAIRLIVVVYGGLFLYHVIRDYSTLKEYVKDIPSFPLASFLTIFPFIILPIAVFPFWKRRSLGWTLLIIFLTFSSVGILWALFNSFSWRPSGIAGLDNLFQRTSSTTYIIQLLFLTGTIYVICKPNMREVFSISNNKMQSTIAITGIISFFLIMYIS